MSEIIGSYQVTNFTTPVNGGSLDASVVLSNDNVTRTNHNSHDNDPGVHFQSSTLAARPSAGTLGRKWFTTDGLRVYYDTGAAWSEIDYLCKTAGGTVAGATTFSGTLQAVGFSVTGNAPVTSGSSVDIQLTGGQGYLTAYDHTGAAFLPLNLRGLAINFAPFASGLTGWTINSSGHFVPAADNAYNLGAGGTRVANVFAVGVTATTGTFSGQVQAATLFAKGASTTSWPATHAVVASGAGFAYLAVGNGNTADSFVAIGGASAIMTFNTMSDAGVVSEKARLQAGTFLLGTTVTTGAGAGEAVLANGKALRGVNAAGTGTVVLIDVGPSDVIRIGLSGTSIMSFGGPGTISGALQGDLVIGNTKGLRASNAGSTTTYPLIQLTAADNVQIGDNTRPIGFGTPGSYVSVAGGEAVFAQAKALRSVTAAATGSYPLINGATLNGFDYVQIGAAGSVVAIGAPAVLTSAGAGEMVFAKNTSIRRANNADTATSRVITFGSGSNNIIYDADAVAVHLFTTTVAAGTNIGDVAIANNKFFRGNNAGGTTNYALIGLDNTDKVAIDASARGATFGAGAVFAGALSGITTIAMSSTLTGATRLETGKLKGNSGTPGIAVNANLGTGATASVTGTDLGGRIILNAGSGGNAAGIQASVTFNSAYAAAPVVVLSGSSTGVFVQSVDISAANVTTTGFDINTSNALGVGSVLHVGYVVIAL